MIEGGQHVAQMPLNRPRRSHHRLQPRMGRPGAFSLRPFTPAEASLSINDHEIFTGPRPRQTHRESRGRAAFIPIARPASIAALFAAAALVIAMPNVALIQPYRRHFRAEKIKTDGATIYVRAGGRGPAVVMLHGFGDTGDMWAPLAAAMVSDRTIAIPDHDSGFWKQWRAFVGQF